MGKCICPKCKSKNVIPIMYGYPSHDAVKEARKGNIKLGGCEIWIDGFDMPDRYCKDCENEWCVDRLGPESITKARFKYWHNWEIYVQDSDVKEKWVFEIFKDGTIKYSSYSQKSKKILDKEKAFVDIDKVEMLYEGLLDALKPWNAAYESTVCDGSSYRLDVTYCDGRKKTHTGDICGGTIGKLIMGLIKAIPKMKEKLDQGM